MNSWLIRVLAVVGPIGASLATTLVVQRALPEPEGIGVVGQAMILMAIAFAILYPAEQATRRLAPIAMLLKLSLSFPSAAPSRFAVARRSANVPALRKDVRLGHGDPAGSMLALVAALTSHDSRTRGHSERVRVFSEMLAVELELDEPARERLRWSALLHDIGKLAVAEEVLNKPAKLDEDQWVLMRRHPEEGERLIAPLAPWLGEWASAVVEHHERLDGSGYPRGIAEGQISLGARIIAVADAYDTMVTPRSYHRPISASAARQEVVRMAGRQFDPRVVRALLSLSIPRLWWRIGLGAWLAQLPLMRPRKPKEGKSEAPAPGGLATIVGLGAVAALTALAPTASVGNLLPVAPEAASDAVADGNETPATETVDQAAVTPSAANTPRSGTGGGGPTIEPGSTPDPAVASPPSSGSGPGQERAQGSGDGGAGSGGAGGAVGGAGGAVGQAAVGSGGLVIEANEDAVMTGQTVAPAPGVSPSPPVAGPAAGSGTSPDGGTVEGTSGTGHDKCNGAGHEHHEQDAC